jgi:hypothetical protein
MSLQDPDAFYQSLVELHEGLDAEESQELNGRVILLMAHHIGDDAIVMRLLKEAAASN